MKDIDPWMMGNKHINPRIVTACYLEEWSWGIAELSEMEHTKKYVLFLKKFKSILVSLGQLQVAQSTYIYNPWKSGPQKIFVVIYN